MTATVTSSLLQALRPATPSPERVRIAASVAFLGLAARLVSPALGSTLSSGIVPQLGADRLYWRPAATGILPLACGPVDGWAIDQRAGTDPDAVALLTKRRSPRCSPSGPPSLRVSGCPNRSSVGISRRQSPVPRRPSPAAAGVPNGRPPASLPRSSGNQGWPERERSSLPTPTAAPRRGRFRRNSCCLLYRAGGGFCGDCVLAIRTS